MQLRQQHKLTVPEYFSIGELSTKTELIDGVIYDMVPPGPNHSYVVRTLNKMLTRLVSDQVIVSQEQPVQLLPKHAPQPDIALLQYRTDEYRYEHPKAADILAIIEVSDSTLSYDATDKMRLYARAGIACYVDIDLLHGHIIVHTQADHSTYKSIKKTKEINLPGLNIVIPLEAIV